MTEDEAKTKWCPYAVVSEYDGGGVRSIAGGPQNRGFALGGPLHNCHCIGSACMAFRWLRYPTESAVDAIRRYRIETGATLKDAKDYVDSHPEYFQHPDVGDGYCGLAGRP